MTIARPNRGGPEQYDAPVTVLFTPYTPERRYALEGFYIEYGCGYSREPLCKNRPIYLLDTNAAQNAACEDHLLPMLCRVIADAQRFGGDFNEHPGFLHALAPARKPSELPLLPYDDNHPVFSTSLDHRYEVQVFRATERPRYGVLVVREGAGAPLLERTVHLIGDATFGADVEDVASWRQLASEAVDSLKPIADRLAEAVSRLKASETHRLDILRSAPNASKVFEKALIAFADPDAAVGWMMQPNAALQGKPPVDGLMSDERVVEVLALVDKIRNWDLRMASRFGRSVTE